MKTTVMLGLTFGLLCPVLVHADAQVAPAATTQAAAPVEVGNKICPVSGDKIGAMGDTVKREYNGKVYNLCCSMCPKDFDKDPAKYAKIADDEVKAEAAAKN